MVHLVGVVIWSGWSGDLGVPGGLCCQCDQGGQGCPVGSGDEVCLCDPGSPGGPGCHYGPGCQGVPGGLGG